MTSKEIIVEQLKACHNEAYSFVPLNTAIEGLTAEEAAKHTGDPNNSVIAIVNHITFWTERLMRRLKGEDNPKFEGTNDNTFAEVEADWEISRQRADKVLAELTDLVNNADDSKLTGVFGGLEKEDTWASFLVDLTLHNAYHIGQIVTLRKQFGNWDPAKGVQ